MPLLLLLLLLLLQRSQLRGRPQPPIRQVVGDADEGHGAARRQDKIEDGRLDLTRRQRARRRGRGGARASSTRRGIGRCSSATREQRRAHVSGHAREVDIPGHQLGGGGRVGGRCRLLASRWMGDRWQLNRIAAVDACGGRFGVGGTH